MQEKKYVQDNEDASRSIHVTKPVAHSQELLGDLAEVGPSEEVGTQREHSNHVNPWKMTEI